MERDEVGEISVAQSLGGQLPGCVRKRSNEVKAALEVSIDCCADDTVPLIVLLGPSGSPE